MTLAKYNVAGEQMLNEAGFAPQAVVFGAYVTGNPVVGGTGQTIIFNAEQFDPFGYYDATTGRFQPKVPGYYRVSWWVRDQTNPPVNGYMYSELWKNGAAAVGDGTFMTASGAPDSSNGSVTVYFNGTTDYVDVRHYRSDSASVALVATNPGHCGFYGELVAASVGVAPEPWHVVGAAGEPGFAAGWSASAQSPKAPPRFYKDPHGIVHVSGTGKYTSGGSATVFTLPVGYRPIGPIWFTGSYWAASTWSLADRAVQDTGDVKFYNATDAGAPVTDYAALNGISFRAEQ